MKSYLKKIFFTVLGVSCLSIFSMQLLLAQGPQNTASLQIFSTLRKAFEERNKYLLANTMISLRENPSLLSEMSKDQQREIFRIGKNNQHAHCDFKNALLDLIHFGLDTDEASGDSALSAKDQAMALRLQTKEKMSLGPTRPLKKKLLQKMKEILKISTPQFLPSSVYYDGFKEHHLFISAGQESWGKELAKKHPEILVTVTDFYSIQDKLEKANNFQVKKIDNTKLNAFEHFLDNSQDRIEMNSGLCFCGGDQGSCAGVSVEDGNYLVFWQEMIRILNKENPHAEAVFTAGDSERNLEKIVQNAKRAAEITKQKVTVEKIAIKNHYDEVVWGVRIRLLPSGKPLDQ